MFRFLNTLDEANKETSFLWTQVKAIRSELLKKPKLNKNCKAYVSDSERETNFKNLQERLQVLGVTEEVKILPNKIIEEGGKMFVYLNSCPALHWQNYYHHLLFEKSNSEMILSILNAMKNARTKGSRELASKVFVRLADIFQFQYKNFVNRTKWVNNITTVKGKQILKKLLNLTQY